jgi:ABC-type ATPase involved in cell division
MFRHWIGADCRFENAAQVIGIIFSNHRFLERLDVLDVQTLVLEIITRVDLHIDSKLLPDVDHFSEAANSRDDSKVTYGY